MNRVSYEKKKKPFPKNNNSSVIPQHSALVLSDKTELYLLENQLINRNETLNFTQATSMHCPFDFELIFESLNLSHTANDDIVRNIDLKWQYLLNLSKQ